jgi:hypothetical protein
MMASEDLEAQIAQEKRAIDGAVKVPVTQYGPDKSQRCHWCGQLSDDLQRVEVLHGYERHKGRCCRGKE